ncbi:hypothetical protein SEVIR_2G148800v4 [Setaria viridis]
MALAAALARAATLLLRGGGGVPPAASAAAVPGISLRIHRQLCGLSTVDEPAAAGEADPWEEAEAEILRDVEPVVELVKDILHSRRYENGGFLSPTEEKVVVEKVLSHHPCVDEKIGCGLDGIMVSIMPNPIYQIHVSSSNKFFTCVPVTFQILFPFVPTAFLIKCVLLRNFVCLLLEVQKS